MAIGTCINSTGETILVYGTVSPETPQDKENALYRLPASRKTPDNWDCDGIYVPNDRIAEQVIDSNIPGPVAIKYIGSLTFEIKKDGDKYDLPLNQGDFKPDEICCPSNYPICVCWDIPNKASNELSEYPEVPNHIAA